MGRLEGKAALVTGGGGGIGSASLRRFVAEGAAVVCADVDEEAGAKTVAELEGAGAAANFVRCDVGSLEDVRAAVEACVSRHGRIVDTPMFDAVLALGLISREAIAEKHAIGRIIEPDEIANLALFLASDESSAITGQAIVIDGGLLSSCDLTGIPPVS